MFPSLVSHFQPPLSWPPHLASPADDYVAIFGSGCASIGGASRCGAATLSLDELKELVRGRPRGDGAMDRVLVADGPTGGVVLNQ